MQQLTVERRRCVRLSMLMCIFSSTAGWNTRTGYGYMYNTYKGMTLTFIPLILTHTIPLTCCLSIFMHFNVLQTVHTCENAFIYTYVLTILWNWQFSSIWIVKWHVRWSWHFYCAVLHGIYIYTCIPPRYIRIFICIYIFVHDFFFFILANLM